jgi:hypothetical protein
MLASHHHLSWKSLLTDPSAASLFSLKSIPKLLVRVTLLKPVQNWHIVLLKIKAKVNNKIEKALHKKLTATCYPPYVSSPAFHCPLSYFTPLSRHPCCSSVTAERGLIFPLHRIFFPSYSLRSFLTLLKILPHTHT